MVSQTISTNTERIALNKTFITTEEALHRYGTSRSKLSRLARAGKINRYRSLRDQRACLYRVTELEEIFQGEPVVTPLDAAA